MSVTVSAFITELNARKDNAVATSTKVAWVNTVETAVYEDTYKEFRMQFYNRTKNVYQYSLPSGCLWDDVITLYVDGTEYQKRTLADDKADRSYYYDDSKINIYPVPTENDANYVSGSGQITFKAISYTSGASELTFASGSITTTGSSFVTAGFVVNNVIQISNCIDQTGNNVTATITAVSASVLTFDTGTFTAQAETGTVSIKTNCIYTSGVDFDGFTAGEYALVSGCTSNTANNKYAIIAYVGDDVLTFAEGTFTAQVESHAVTIQQPKIKMAYKYRRTAKTEALIASETLSLPDRFIEMYYQYCIAQIHAYENEFEIYNNWMGFYNASVADYEKWYSNVREIKHDFTAENGW
jgi:hypothetical protein